LDACTPESLVETLWQIGFLRAETRQDARRRPAGAGSFLGSHQASQQIVASAQRFQVHPMFWSYLGSQGTHRSSSAPARVVERRRLPGGASAQEPDGGEDAGGSGGEKYRGPGELEDPDPAGRLVGDPVRVMVLGGPPAGVY